MAGKRGRSSDDERKLIDKFQLLRRSLATS